MGRVGVQPVDKGWWIWTRGTRHEGEGSRTRFPPCWLAPSLPTLTRQVPDPIPAQSVVPEWGWSCGVSLCQTGAEINVLSWPLGSREQGGAGSVRPISGQEPASGETVRWVSGERPLQFIHP